MFVSMPEYKFFVPPELSAPGAAFWRSLGLSTQAAWYVITLRPRHKNAMVETFLLAWDRDIPGALESLDADLVALLFVAPHVGTGHHGWFSRQIAEVWEGTDPDDENPCVILVDQEGVAHSGYFMERGRSLKRERLIARANPAFSDPPRGVPN